MHQRVSSKWLDALNSCSCECISQSVAGTGKEMKDKSKQSGFFFFWEHTAPSSVSVLTFQSIKCFFFPFLLVHLFIYLWGGGWGDTYPCCCCKSVFKGGSVRAPPGVPQCVQTVQAANLWAWKDNFTFSLYNPKLLRRKVLQGASYDITFDHVAAFYLRMQKQRCIWKNRSSAFFSAEKPMQVQSEGQSTQRIQP